MLIYWFSWMLIYCNAHFFVLPTENFSLLVIINKSILVCFSIYTLNNVGAISIDGRGGECCILNIRPSIIVHTTTSYEWEHYPVVISTRIVPRGFLHKGLCHLDGFIWYNL